MSGIWMMVTSIETMGIMIRGITRDTTLATDSEMIKICIIMRTIKVMVPVEEISVFEKDLGEVISEIVAVMAVVARQAIER
jgi:hypothetical protein